MVGGTGTIGSAVTTELAKLHDVITVGRISGDYHVDITDRSTISKMFQKIGPFDALVATLGAVHFAPLAKMKHENYMLGLQSKLMGQVDLVLTGLDYINHHGSFTLTSGILATDPIVSGSSASMVNNALHGFVIGAAIEMPKNIRINVVSPTIITESLPNYGDMFLGFKPVDVETVAFAYSKSVNGAQTGQIYKVGY